MKNNNSSVNIGTKQPKDITFKTMINALILSRGFSIPEFYHDVGLTKQYWYSISWRIQEPPIEVKMKIAKVLGVDSRVIWP